MSEEDKNNNESQKSSNTNTKNETQVNPMQLVQAKTLSTIVQFSEDQVKKSGGKESGN